MKKRSVLILVIGIAAIGVLAACAILFRSTPVLEEGKHYTIVHAEDWPDGYQSRKELDLQGKEAEILSCLSEQSQRCAVGYSAPVYQILEKEPLYTSLKHLLVS